MDRQPDRNTDKHSGAELAREEVVIYTDREMIEGTLCFHKGMRLSDALNAPAAQRDRPHIALVNASVTSLETGIQFLAARFLLVSRHKIIVLLPKSEVLHAELAGHGRPALTQEMPQLPQQSEMFGMIGAIKPDRPIGLTSMVEPENERLLPPRDLSDTIGDFRMDSKSSTLDLIQALEDKDPLVRKGAVMALANLGADAKNAVPALIEALKNDSDELVRRQSIVALGNIGPEAGPAVPTLVDALKDPDELVRRQAVVALGNIGPEARDAIPSLIEALSDENEFVRGRAADALGRIGADAQTAIPALSEALEDGDMIVRHWASVALEKIQGRR